MIHGKELLKFEFEEIKDNPLSELGYTVELSDKNIFKWIVSLKGPKDTPYADGIFFIELNFPEDFPNSGPNMKFLTPIYNPLVNSPGGRFVGNFIHGSNPSTKVREILTKIYAIFYIPNPENAYSGEAIRDYRDNRFLFELKAKYFTKKYSNIISNSDKWDFSFGLKDLGILDPKPTEKIIYKNDKNERIQLILDINGSCRKYKIEIYSFDKIEELIKKINTIFNIELKSNILFIFNRRKLENSSTFGENGLKNGDVITIISDALF